MKLFGRQITLTRALAPLEPERVLELSTNEIENLRDAVADLSKRTGVCERAIEATRRKVYRDYDETSKNNGDDIPSVATNQASPVSYRTGDPI